MTALPENYLMEMASLFSKKQTFYIVSSAYQLLLECPFPIFFRLYRKKSQKFCRLWNFNYLQHTQLQKKKTTSVSCTSATTLQVKEKIQDMQQDFQHLSCNDVFETQHHSYKQPYRGINRWFDIILQTLDCQVLIGL